MDVFFYILIQIITSTHRVRVLLEIEAKHVHYDDVDILPSSSLFDESYPEFYGYHTLS